MKNIRPLYWKNHKAYIMNQLLLPDKVVFNPATNHIQVAKAIKDMVIRGAPAIGIIAAFGMALASKEKKFKTVDELLTYVKKAGDHLVKSRPTAVNLFWAVQRMMNRLVQFSIDSEEFGNEQKQIKFVQDKIEKEALNVWEEDVEMNRKISKFGASLIEKNSKIITHCNAGALATGGIGTALGVITEAHKQGKVQMVYADETRPYLQGARLTAWELKQMHVPVTLITDNMAGYIMNTENVRAIIVGADRITKNGDTANKIGTYSLAILARFHNIPFYVAAPTSTIDLNKKTGKEIPIEERSSEEVTTIAKKRMAPKNVLARHPAFDVTPAELIKSIITEKGVFTYPYNF